MWGLIQVELINVSKGHQSFNKNIKGILLRNILKNADDQRLKMKHQSDEESRETHNTYTRCRNYCERNTT